MTKASREGPIGPISVKRRVVLSWSAGWLLASMAFALDQTCHEENIGAAMTFRLMSPSFDDQMDIPTKHTCEGADVSVPLAWSGVPKGTKSLALIVDDPDAPDPRAPKMTWVHWVVYNLPPTLTALPEGAPVTRVADSAREGRNDWKATGYRGPCPPVGRHRYFLKLYALDVTLSDLGEPDKAELEAAMAGHILGQATLMGTYAKHGRG